MLDWVRAFTPLLDGRETLGGLNDPVLLAAHWSWLHVAEQDTCRFDRAFHLSSALAGSTCAHCGKPWRRVERDRTKFVAAFS